MNITIVNPSKIPALLYGGTERVIWYLGKELTKLGHKVNFLVSEGSKCDFADVIYFDPTKNIETQIPSDTDIVHFNFPIKENITKPYIITIHGNSSPGQIFDLNTVFVSKNHALRHGSSSYVYNGIDWDDYGKPDFYNHREYYHFLGNASWKVKNLKGAIKICKKAKVKLYVLGGNRINFKMGFRITLSPKVKFFGMVGGEEKNKILSNSAGLIFPVLWEEPFGLSIIESMYFGCPVFGTPKGSLPELVTEETGFLSENYDEIVEKIKSPSNYNKKKISEYALENFNSRKMAERYLKKYELVLSGKKLNETNPINKLELINK